MKRADGPEPSGLAGAGPVSTRPTAIDQVFEAAAGPTLAAVLQGAAASIGVTHDVPERTGGEAQTSLGMPDVTKTCVMLIDGLGYRCLMERGGHAPFLRSLARDSNVIRAPFPSTTAVSLGVFGTGRSAGQTGLLGYSLVDPAIDRIMSLLAWDGATAPEAWQPHPSVFETCRVADVPATFVGLSRFEGSGLTRAAMSGATFLGVSRSSDGIDRAIEELSRPGPRLVYLYWGDIDRVGHEFGWKSRQWGEALEILDGHVRELASRLPARTSLHITADHGMVDIPVDARIDVGLRSDLTEGIRHVAGEPRALHLYCLPDRAAETANRWRAEFDGAAAVFTREQLVDANIFGPVDERVNPLIGDLIVVTTDDIAIVDSRTQSPGAMSLVGMHGSTSPMEMEIPLMTVPPRGKA